MTLNYGFDFQYANTRLHDSVVRLKDGTPYHVFEVWADGIVMGCLCTGQDLESNMYELDLSPVPLGYCNNNLGLTSYLSRKPARKWRQGLRKQTLNISGRANVEVLSPILAKTIRGIYPSFTFCLDSVMNDEAESMAFSRDFCVGNYKGSSANKKLFFRGTPVGVVRTLDNNPVTQLTQDFKYLEASLNEALNENY